MSENTKKTDRRIVRSKIALREALLALMAQKNFASISITEIVEVANYNRGTFYAKYESKEELLDEIIANLTQQLLQSFPGTYETGRFGINELHAKSVMIFENFFQNASIYTVFVKSECLPKLKDNMFTALKKINSRRINLLRKRQRYGSSLAEHLFHSRFTRSHIPTGLKVNLKIHPHICKISLLKSISWRPTEAKNRNEKSCN